MPASQVVMVIEGRLSQGAMWKELPLIFCLHFMEEQIYEPNPKSKGKWENGVESS